MLRSVAEIGARGSRNQVRIATRWRTENRPHEVVCAGSVHVADPARAPPGLEVLAAGVPPLAEKPQRGEPERAEPDESRDDGCTRETRVDGPARILAMQDGGLLGAHDQGMTRPCPDLLAVRSGFHARILPRVRSRVQAATLG
jgi:hypothetical protein